MKIRLVLGITFILFSITSGIENFGMDEKNDFEIDTRDNDNKGGETNAFYINNNENRNNNSYSRILFPRRLNMENDNLPYGNINSSFLSFKRPCDLRNGENNTNKYYIKINKPFAGDQDKNELFFYFFRRVKCIYEGTLGITLFEILTSFGISILNNIFGFEKMVKNKFYANMFLLKFGFKFVIPILSFIIVDFNICIYNWLVSDIKYLMVRCNRAPLDQLKIKWKASSFEKNLKFIYLLNTFNIDIKLNLFGLSLCIPLTKILETLLICKLIQEVDYKKNTKSSYLPFENIGETYKSIHKTVERKNRNAKNIMFKNTNASEKVLSTLEKISTKAKDFFLPKKDNNNPNNNLG